MTFTTEELEVILSCVEKFVGEDDETDAVLKKLQEALGQDD